MFKNLLGIFICCTTLSLSLLPLDQEQQAAYQNETRKNEALLSVLKTQRLGKKKPTPKKAPYEKPTLPPTKDNTPSENTLALPSKIMSKVIFGKSTISTDDLRDAATSISAIIDRETGDTDKYAKDFSLYDKQEVESSDGKITTISTIPTIFAEKSFHSPLDPYSDLISSVPLTTTGERFTDLVAPTIVIDESAEILRKLRNEEYFFTYQSEQDEGQGVQPLTKARLNELARSNEPYKIQSSRNDSEPYWFFELLKQGGVWYEESNSPQVKLTLSILANIVTTKDYNVRFFSTNQGVEIFRSIWQLRKQKTRSEEQLNALTNMQKIYHLLSNGRLWYSEKKSGTKNKLTPEILQHLLNTNTDFIVYEKAPESVKKAITPTERADLSATPYKKETNIQGSQIFVPASASDLSAPESELYIAVEAGTNNVKGTLSPLVYENNHWYTAKGKREFDPNIEHLYARSVDLFAILASGVTTFFDELTPLGSARQPLLDAFAPLLQGVLNIPIKAANISIKASEPFRKALAFKLTGEKLWQLIDTLNLDTTVTHAAFYFENYTQNLFSAFEEDTVTLETQMPIPINPADWLETLLRFIPTSEQTRNTLHQTAARLQTFFQNHDDADAPDNEEDGPTEAHQTLLAGVRAMAAAVTGTIPEALNEQLHNLFAHRITTAARQRFFSSIIEQLPEYARQTLPIILNPHATQDVRMRALLITAAHYAFESFMLKLPQSVITFIKNTESSDLTIIVNGLNVNEQTHPIFKALTPKIPDTIPLSMQAQKTILTLLFENLIHDSELFQDLLPFFVAQNQQTEALLSNGYISWIIQYGSTVLSNTRSLNKTQQRYLIQSFIDAYTRPNRFNITQELAWISEGAMKTALEKMPEDAQRLAMAIVNPHFDSFSAMLAQKMDGLKTAITSKNRQTQKKQSIPKGFYEITELKTKQSVLALAAAASSTIASDAQYFVVTNSIIPEKQTNEPDNSFTTRVKLFLEELKSTPHARLAQPVSLALHGDTTLLLDKPLAVQRGDYLHLYTSGSSIKLNDQDRVFTISKPKTMLDTPITEGAMIVRQVPLLHTIPLTDDAYGVWLEQEIKPKIQAFLKETTIEEAARLFPYNIDQLPLWTEVFFGIPSPLTRLACSLDSVRTSAEEILKNAQETILGKPLADATEEVIQESIRSLPLHIEDLRHSQWEKALSMIETIYTKIPYPLRVLIRGMARSSFGPNGAVKTKLYSKTTQSKRYYRPLSKSLYEDYSYYIQEAQNPKPTYKKISTQEIAQLPADAIIVKSPKKHASFKKIAPELLKGLKTQLYTQERRPEGEIKRYKALSVAEQAQQLQAISTNTQQQLATTLTDTIELAVCIDQLTEPSQTAHMAEFILLLKKAIDVGNWKLYSPKDLVEMAKSKNVSFTALNQIQSLTANTQSAENIHYALQNNTLESIIQGFEESLPLYNPLEKALNYIPHRDHEVQAAQLQQHIEKNITPLLTELEILAEELGLQRNEDDEQEMDEHNVFIRFIQFVNALLQRAISHTNQKEDETLSIIRKHAQTVANFTTIAQKTPRDNLYLLLSRFNAIAAHFGTLSLYQLIKASKCAYSRDPLLLLGYFCAHLHVPFYTLSPESLFITMTRILTTIAQYSTHAKTDVFALWNQLAQMPLDLRRAQIQAMILARTRLERSKDKEDAVRTISQTLTRPQNKYQKIEQFIGDIVSLENQIESYKEHPLKSEVAIRTALEAIGTHDLPELHQKLLTLIDEHFHTITPAEESERTNLLKTEITAINSATENIASAIESLLAQWQTQGFRIDDSHDHHSRSLRAIFQAKDRFTGECLADVSYRERQKLKLEFINNCSNTIRSLLAAPIKEERDRILHPEYQALRETKAAQIDDLEKIRTDIIDSTTIQELNDKIAAFDQLLDSLLDSLEQFAENTDIPQAQAEASQHIHNAIQTLNEELQASFIKENAAIAELKEHAHALLKTENRALSALLKPLKQATERYCGVLDRFDHQESTFKEQAQIIIQQSLEHPTRKQQQKLTQTYDAYLAATEKDTTKEHYMRALEEYDALQMLQFRLIFAPILTSVQQRNNLETLCQLFITKRRELFELAQSLERDGFITLERMKKIFTYTYQNHNEMVTAYASLQKMHASIASTTLSLNTIIKKEATAASLAATINLRVPNEFAASLIKQNRNHKPLSITPISLTLNSKQVGVFGLKLLAAGKVHQFFKDARNEFVVTQILAHAEELYGVLSPTHQASQKKYIESFVNKYCPYVKWNFSLKGSFASVLLYTLVYEFISMLEEQVKDKQTYQDFLWSLWNHGLSHASVAKTGKLKRAELGILHALHNDILPKLQTEGTPLRFSLLPLIEILTGSSNIIENNIAALPKLITQTSIFDLSGATIAATNTPYGTGVIPLSLMNNPKLVAYSPLKALIPFARGKKIHPPLYDKPWFKLIKNVLIGYFVLKSLDTIHQKQLIEFISLQQGTFKPLLKEYLDAKRSGIATEHIRKALAMQIQRVSITRHPSLISRAINQINMPKLGEILQLAPTLIRARAMSVFKVYMLMLIPIVFNITMPKKIKLLQGYSIPVLRILSLLNLSKEEQVYEKI